MSCYKCGRDLPPGEVECAEGECRNDPACQCPECAMRRSVKANPRHKILSIHLLIKMDLDKMATPAQKAAFKAAIQAFSDQVTAALAASGLKDFTP